MHTISTGHKESRIVSAILDTGPDPDLIMEDALSTVWLKKKQQIRTVVQAAAGTTFNIEGILRLQVNIAGHKTTAVFDFAPKLGIKMILGTASIDEEGKSIKMHNFLAYSAKRWPSSRDCQKF